MGISSNSAIGVRSEINITPLVDVVLVLLIIFMVAQPMMQLGYDSAIPAPPPPGKVVPPTDGFILGLAVDPVTGALGEIRLNRELVPRPELAGRVRQEMLRLAPRDRVLFIDCDDRVNYNDLLRVVDELRQAGVTTVGFATTPVEAGA